MARLLRIKTDGAKVIRQGSEFFWEKMMSLTEADGTVSFKQLDGACDPHQEANLRYFLKRMTAAGIIQLEPTKERRYRLLQRQTACPLIAGDGEISKIGRRQQQMWNVMRRAHGGFTTPDLAIDASTDDVTVTRMHARKYCSWLRDAGILILQTRGKRSHSHHIYVLKGSANTGPLPPRRILQGTAMFDPNRGQIFGDIIAREEGQ